jgi:DNA (cytosine-5)-methyltransferase 1
MNELHLFAGAGGGILGGMLLGHACVCAVEVEPYCRKVLLQRQRDGILPKFPIWDDVRTFDGKPWRGLVDVVCGGFPCQDISAAGKGAGIDGSRSGLWSEMARIIGEIRPRFAFVENSPMLLSRGIGRVLGDLAEMGYDSRWGVVSASDAGAPHLRERIWILANATCRASEVSWAEWARRELPSGRSLDCGRTDWQRVSFSADCDEDGMCSLCGLEYDERDGILYARPIPDTEEPGLEGPDATRDSWADGFDREPGPGRWETDWWQSEPGLGRVAHGVADRSNRLKAIGNGQVPQVAALAWRILMNDSQPL